MNDVEMGSAPEDDGAWARWATAGSLTVVLAFTTVWLWPLGVGGRMPVGGDTTRFSLGLAGFLDRSLQEGRIPFWNDLWGYGFPGLAESQMGVYYPPHLVLYGLLPVEAAYTASLALHVAWGALGAWWAARRFGATPAGSVLAAIAWGGSGLFVVHLPHPWAYTVGSWMPWVFATAWGVVDRETGSRGAAALAALLALQVLPGHFQLAFITQVVVVLLALWGLIERRYGGSLRLLVALPAVVPLTAAQLWPTARLASLAEGGRDFDYLSAFAQPPTHLVTWLTPRLFHRSPLWRPLVWDPFHAMPEEAAAYVGLAPLFLAGVAVWALWRTDAAVRALVVVAVLTLLLALGPYFPGFGLLIRLPGFSFFRAPARWTLMTELAIALLAAKGLTALSAGYGTRRALAGFALAVVVLPAIAVGVVEGVLRGTETPATGPVAALVDRGLALRPWRGDVGVRPLAEAARRKPGDNPIVVLGLMRRGIDPSRARLDLDRGAIYGEELLPSAAAALALLVVAAFARTPARLRYGLVGLTAIELIALSRTRDVESAPIRPLVDQSPVLARLARARDRSIDPMGNLPMLVGGAPVTPYRTLDLPTMAALNSEAQRFPGAPKADPRVVRAIAATGAPLRVFGPLDVLGMSRIRPEWPGTLEYVEDPALAAWELGSAWTRPRGRAATTYAFWRPGLPTSRAWFLPGRTATDIPATADFSTPARVLALLAEARPLAWISDRPEHFRMEVEAKQPGVVMVSILDHPEWFGIWQKEGGRVRRPARPRAAFADPRGGAWQLYEVPGTGVWSLNLRYRGIVERFGLAISIAAWMIWGAVFWMFSRRRKSDAAEAIGGAMR